MEPEIKLTAESAAAFHEGIGMLMSRWSSLQLAVENGWGGRDSHLIAEQLHSDVFTWFLNTPLQELYIDDLEVMLEQGMDRLSTTLEDGSIGEVADKLMIMHEECLVSNFSSIEKLREANGRRVPPLHVRQVLNDDEDDTDEDDDGDRSMGRDDSSNMMVDKQGTARPEAQQKMDGRKWDQEKIGVEGIRSKSLQISVIFYLSRKICVCCKTK